jgi:hypothetical protein
MTELVGPELFQTLSADLQAQHLAVGQRLTRLAQDHAIPIVFAPPLSVGGKINSASGFALRLNPGAFLVTASHVLDEYEKRVLAGEVLNWQVGNLPPYDPVPRVAWRHGERDLVFLRLSEDELTRIGPCTISTPPQWPPFLPQVGQLVVVAGYPKALREDDPSSGWIGSGPYSAVFPVTTVGSGYCISKIEHKELVSFNGGPLPEPDTDMGGLSGGPVLLVGNLSYPVVGAITQRWQLDSVELVRFATLESVVIADLVGPPPSE